jgi:uncharacterized protein YkuJ
MLLFVNKNNIRGRTKMAEDGIMDKKWRRFTSNGTDIKKVAFSK